MFGGRLAWKVTAIKRCLGYFSNFLLRLVIHVSVKNIQCTFQALKKVRNAKLDSIRDLFSSFNKEELNVKGYKR